MAQPVSPWDDVPLHRSHDSPPCPHPHVISLLSRQAELPGIAVILGLFYPKLLQLLKNPETRHDEAENSNFKLLLASRRSEAALNRKITSFFGSI